MRGLHKPGKWRNFHKRPCKYKSFGIRINGKKKVFICCLGVPLLMISILVVLRTAVQETLSVVQSIEDALNSSESIRQEVMSLHQETDQMIANISNITQTVGKLILACLSTYCVDF